MLIITDNPAYSSKFFNFENENLNEFGSSNYTELETAFLSAKSYTYQINNSFWKYALFTEFAENSQFDQLLKLRNEKIEIPNKSFYFAGSGRKFHGFRNRSWEARDGNIHLSCYFKPYLDASSTGLGFTILSAVSVIDTLDELPELRDIALIKWVNDIVVVKAKICGVIAQTQIQGHNIVDAVIGIGLNVEQAPEITPTSFVPVATSINQVCSKKYSVQEINSILIEKIAANYLLLEKYGVNPLLEKYISRSLIIGKNISVWTDNFDTEPKLIAKGKVRSIGEYLELYIEGLDAPITSGRIVQE